MRYKIVYIVWLLLCKNCADNDDILQYMKTSGVVAFGMTDKWVQSFFPLFRFSDLSITSVSYILNDSKIDGEETTYSLKSRFCFNKTIFYGDNNGAIY